MALLLFGGSGKISNIMGDVAKGIKSFKKGMAEDDDAPKKDEAPRLSTRGRKAGRNGRGQEGRLNRLHARSERPASSDRHYVKQDC